MAEYIDRDAAVSNLELLARHEDRFRQSVILGVVDTIRAMEAADVAPVVRGRWKASSVLLECQNCGEIYSRLGGNGGKAWNYCPNYGARMDYKE